MKFLPKLFLGLIAVTIFIVGWVFISKQRDIGDSSSNLAMQVLWQSDDLQVATSVLPGTFYGTANVGGTYLYEGGVIFTEIRQNDREPRYITISGDVSMHVDFVSDSHIGIDVTDSVGRRPAAFVVNRETQEVKTVATDTNGAYLAGAHSGDKMLMASSSGLFIASLDQQKLVTFPGFTVEVEGMNTDFQLLDGAFSPDDTSIVVMGVGTLEDSEDRGGERTVFWVLKPFDASVTPNVITPLGQIDADSIKWESETIFSLWQAQGDDEVFVARFEKTGLGLSESWSKIE